jgi:hypothetical protein
MLCRAARSRTSTCRTPRARVTPTSTATSTHSWTSRPLVLDERYNEGGFIADYVVNVLGQKLLSGAIERSGRPVHDPVGAIFGPKAMIINQSAGSGGDAMPWYFRKSNLGTLVGTNTWGGLVGIGGYPTLIDGGRVTAPRYAIYGLQGRMGGGRARRRPRCGGRGTAEGCGRRTRCAARTCGVDRYRAIEAASGDRTQGPAVSQLSRARRSRHPLRRGGTLSRLYRGARPAAGGGYFAGCTPPSSAAVAV